MRDCDENEAYTIYIMAVLAHAPPPGSVFYVSQPFREGDE